MPSPLMSAFAVIGACRTAPSPTTATADTSAPEIIVRKYMSPPGSIEF